MRTYETVANNCTIKEFVTAPVASGFLTMNGGKIVNPALSLLALMTADQKFKLNHTDFRTSFKKLKFRELELVYQGKIDIKQEQLFFYISLVSLVSSTP